MCVKKKQRPARSLSHVQAVKSCVHFHGRTDYYGTSHEDNSEQECRAGVNWHELRCELKIDA